VSCDLAWKVLEALDAEDYGVVWVYFAMGSGVTPNQASSVIQMPLSYCSQILKR